MIITLKVSAVVFSKYDFILFELFTRQKKATPPQSLFMGPVPLSVTARALQREELENSSSGLQEKKRPPHQRILD